MTQAVLQMSNISKSFNGVGVLHQVDFELRAGEIHALMGGNGAGKSTLMKILTGVYQMDEGEITIDGKPVKIDSTQRANEHGISMIFQEFSLVPTLTVAENVYLNKEPRTKLGLIDQKKIAMQTKAILQDLQIDIDPDCEVGKLGVGYWQITEIAKALTVDTKILIMDEPTSSLTKIETELLFQLMDRLKAKGIAIIYISHRMDEIFRVCDRVTVLRDGKNCITAKTSEIEMEQLIEHIVGNRVGEAFQWVERSYDVTAPPLFQVKNLTIGTRVKNVSFEIKPGEIIGLAGLMGSGRTELARGLFGLDPYQQGEIYVHGQRKRISSPQDAIKAGIALVPEDRRTQGLVLEHSVRDNIALSILPALTKGLFVSSKASNEIAHQYVDKLSIKTDNIYKLSGLLSGGNQQKIVIAKWLATNPDILILDEPTIGVDINAKIEIVKIIREFANSGKAVLVISSELVELLAVSDKILIMQKGEITAEHQRQNITSEEALEHAIQSF